MFLSIPFKLAFENKKKKEEKKYDSLALDSKKKDYNISLLIFPSLCDVCATILDCIGLIFVIYNFNYLFCLNVDSCICPSNVKRFYGDIYMYFICN